MAKTNIPATGTFSPPPPNAPKEVSAPLTPQALADMQKKAAENEGTISPMAAKNVLGAVPGESVPGPVQTPAPPPSLLKAAIQKATATAVAAQTVLAPPSSPGLAIPGVEDTLGGVGQSGQGPGLVESPPDQPGPFAGRSPDTGPDTGTDRPYPTAPQPTVPDPVLDAKPARGQPRPILDPGKRITGGWGMDPGFQPQYYALDGTEVQALAHTLWKELAASMETDLRFHIAVCYPQALVRVSVEVTGSVPGAPINDVAFTTSSRILLLSAEAADTDTTPADALRDRAGVVKPFKHHVTTASGPQLVDRD